MSSAQLKCVETAGFGEFRVNLGEFSMFWSFLMKPGDAGRVLNAVGVGYGAGGLETGTEDVFGAETTIFCEISSEMAFVVRNFVFFLLSRSATNSDMATRVGELFSKFCNAPKSLCVSIVAGGDVGMTCTVLEHGEGDLMTWRLPWVIVSSWGASYCTGGGIPLIAQCNCSETSDFERFWCKTADFRVFGLF